MQTKDENESIDNLYKRMKKCEEFNKEIYENNKKAVTELHYILSVVQRLETSVQLLINNIVVIKYSISKYKWMLIIIFILNISFISFEIWNRFFS